MTLVANIYGGPGVGKSTTAAEVFAALKRDGCNAEMAHEYAKDLTWEERHSALDFQPYVATRQAWRVHRLLGRVDVIITDSPILLANVYKGAGFTPAFSQWLFDIHHSWETLDVLLERDPRRAYNPAGRTQTEEEAHGVDAAIRFMLMTDKVDYRRVMMGPEGTASIVRQVKMRLGELAAQSIWGKPD